MPMYFQVASTGVKIRTFPGFEDEDHEYPLAERTGPVLLVVAARPDVEGEDVIVV